MLPPFGITLGREQLPAALAGAEAQNCDCRRCYRRHCCCEAPTPPLTPPCCRPLPAVAATAPAQSLRGGGALVHPLFRPALLPLPPTQPDTPRPSPNRPERIDRKRFVIFVVASSSCYSQCHVPCKVVNYSPLLLESLKKKYHLLKVKDQLKGQENNAVFLLVPDDSTLFCYLPQPYSYSSIFIGVFSPLAIDLPLWF
ncbi:hypothetical protein E5288_WYG016734 [Bos mutus]|uniref:Uncharacterized protein n=1 Tax=Bos mutus TaxID=72004 RepID=A0A6B0RA65_9CETA|nr:hypothetical protein [Bos mutus]